MACCKAIGFWPSTVQPTAKQVPKISLAVPLNSFARLFLRICRQMSRKTFLENEPFRKANGETICVYYIYTVYIHDVLFL